MNCETCHKDIKEAQFKIVPAMQVNAKRQVNFFLAVCKECIEKNRWQEIVHGSVLLVETEPHGSAEGL